MAHSPVIPVTVLDAAACEVSVSLKEAASLAARLLALFLIRPTFASSFPITLHRGNRMGETSVQEQI